MLSQLGITTPRTRLVGSMDEARDAIKELGVPCFFQAEEPSRRGIFESGSSANQKLIDTVDEATAAASQILNCPSSNQDASLCSSPIMKKLRVTEHIKSDANWYLAMSVDRESYGPAITISRRGGMTVDEIARLYPDSLYTFSFTLSTGITTSLMSQIQTQLQLSSVQSGNLEHLLHQAFTIFSQKDATLFEINPMTMSKDGSIASLSTNLVIDDAAKKRQPELFLLRDKSKEVAEEVEAEEHGLVYVKMEGDIGVVVNGAGLAMATNDAIGFHGGKSANFLDTGGKATTETMLKAFEIVTRDERVRAILVNIYGGLTRCDMMAESIIGAARELDMRVPMVVRLQGTNSEQGLKMLEEAGLGIDMVVESDWRAARRVVELARGVESTNTC